MKTAEEILDVKRKEEAERLKTGVLAKYVTLEDRETCFMDDCHELDYTSGWERLVSPLDDQVRYLIDDLVDKAPYDRSWGADPCDRAFEDGLFEKQPLLREQDAWFDQTGAELWGEAERRIRGMSKLEIFQMLTKIQATIQYPPVYAGCRLPVFPISIEDGKGYCVLKQLEMEPFLGLLPVAELYDILSWMRSGFGWFTFRRAVKSFRAPLIKDIEEHGFAKRDLISCEVTSGIEFYDDVGWEVRSEFARHGCFPREWKCKFDSLEEKGGAYKDEKPLSIGKWRPVSKGLTEFLDILMRMTLGRLVPDDCKYEKDMKFARLKIKADQEMDEETRQITKLVKKLLKENKE
jgi:hypothetical protein